MFTLTLTPLAASSLPTEDVVLGAGHALIDSVTTWKTGTRSKEGVQAYSKKSQDGGPGWHARISHHSAEELTFDQLWNALGPDHYIHEVEYIHPLKRAEKLKDVELGEVWALHYTFSPPVSPRVFTQLLFKHVANSTPGKRSAYLVQLPFDVEGDMDCIDKQGKGVHGTYVSVEHFFEDDDGKIEWRMCTCSTPGGSIPNWLSERSIPGEILKDVPSLISWVAKQGAKS